MERLKDWVGRVERRSPSPDRLVRMLNRDFASGKAKPRSEEPHTRGRDSLSGKGSTVRGPAGDALPVQDFTNSDQLEAEHEYHRHRHGQVEFFCG